MAYSGSTAASSVANPPVLLARGMGNQTNQSGLVVGTTSLAYGGGNGLWFYSSTDASSDIIASVTYFTDGKQLGMRNGDVILTVYASSVASTTVSMAVGVLGTTNSTNGFSIMTAGCIASS